MMKVPILAECKRAKIPKIAVHELQYIHDLFVSRPETEASLSGYLETRNPIGLSA
jgi:hypothetical protein